MKIQGPGKTTGPSKTKAKGGASESSESFGSMMTPETPSAAPTQGPQSIAHVDALLAVQGAEDPTAGASKKRMRKRSNDLLDGLERIRMAMLGGTMTVGDMINIADVVASHREKIQDPSLTGIMDEIDLRAQVELAKMRKALDSQAAKTQSEGSTA
jgi:hypothetical protein